MIVSQIVRKYLEENGFDGLRGEACGCGLDHFMPCEMSCPDCEPAYRMRCPGSEKCPDNVSCQTGEEPGEWCYGIVKRITKEDAKAKDQE